MAQHWYYNDPDAGLVEFTDHVDDDNSPSITVQAEQSSIGSSTLIVDDPSGELDFTGHREIWWEEDDATWARIATLYTASVKVSRGGYRTGSARTWELSLTDINTLMWRKVMAGNDTDRPAESDVDRVQWLLSTGEAGFFADVTTYVHTGNPVNMDANPDTGYNGQMFEQVMDDCAQQSGKNHYVLDVFDSPNYVKGIWYGADSEPDFTSNLQISNVIGDVDNTTTWYASLDTELNRDPSRIFSGVFGNYDGGYTYQSDAGVIAAYANRDTIANWPNVKTLTKAQARALRMIADLGTAGPEDVITTTILVPPEHVNDARPGQLIVARFTHLPGYEDPTYFRILRRTTTRIAPAVGEQVSYSVEFDLSPIPTPPPPPSCEDLLGLTVTEDGPVEWDDVPGFFTNLTTTPPTPVGTGINYVGWMGATGFTASGDWNLDSGAYTLLNELSAASSPIQGLAAYEAVTSSASLLSVSGPRVDGYTFLSVFIPTAATSPVQVAAQSGTGGSVTFPGTPTPGNIILALMIDSENQSQPPRDLSPYGWTLLHMSDGDTGFGIHTGGIQSISVALWARCVQEGDTATYLVDAESFSHWTLCSEWALT